MTASLGGWSRKRRLTLWRQLRFGDRVGILRPKADLFLSAEPAKAAAILLSAFLPGSERSIGINPFNPALREEVMGLTRKAIVTNRRIKCYRFPVVDELPLRRRQGRNDLLPTTAGAGVGTNGILHTYIEHPRLQVVREVLNERRMQTFNLFAVHSLAVQDEKSE